MIRSFAKVAYVVTAGDATANIARVKHYIQMGKEHTILLMHLYNQNRSWEVGEVGYTMGTEDMAIKIGILLPIGGTAFRASIGGYLKWEGQMKLPINADAIQALVFSPTATDVVYLKVIYEVA